MKNNLENLGKLILLAGEMLDTRPRSSKAVEVYHKYRRLPIILCGPQVWTDGFVIARRNGRTGETSREYLLRNGVKDEDIFLQEKSRDTLADFFYAREQGLITPDEKGVGVDTDLQHMKRALFCSRKVFGRVHEFVAVLLSKP